MKNYISFLSKVFTLILFLSLVNCPLFQKKVKDPLHPNSQNPNGENIVDLGVDSLRGSSYSERSSNAYDDENSSEGGATTDIIRERDNNFIGLSKETFEDFRLGAPVNTLDDIGELKIHVNLRSTDKSKKITDQTWAGKVVISYYDDGRNNPDVVRKVVFKSGGSSDARYNKWINFGEGGGGGKRNSCPNKNCFHGFFQEADGSLILTLNQKRGTDHDVTNNTCRYASGSIWVMQFRTTFDGKKSCNNKRNPYIRDYNKSASTPIPSLSERDKKCWFISIGPYDCRAWKSGSKVNTTKYFEPQGECYTKLGDFKDLNLCKAFNTSAGNSNDFFDYGD